MNPFEIDTELSSCGSSEPFALRVIGDDMAPEFMDGHIIVIDPGGKVKDGCFVVANPNEEFIFRQLKVREDGGLYLQALQPGHPTIDLTNGLDEIVGVVSQRAGKRRKEHKRYDID
jgi:SOS-response transcriptional repressor LexA